MLVAVVTAIGAVLGLAIFLAGIAVGAWLQTWYQRLEVERLRAVIKDTADRIASPTSVPRIEIIERLRAALTE